MDNERQQFLHEIAALDLEQDEDPLATYWRYIQWINRNFPPERAQESGLVDVLEDATKLFLEDDLFKTDLRYLKIWVLYARHVDDPAVVYAHLLSKNIGTTYALLYEEYADLLEKSGNLHQADELYRRGIHRRARPPDRLKTKYEQFQARNPLKDAPNPGHNRYAPMLARPAPGKRPEKLMLDLSLIFTKEGVEYSIQEARARSMGLLGKKWPPPAQTDLDLERTSKVRVDFNEDGTKNFRPGRKSLLPPSEPTVTLATKEALADVFGMYNSPEKSMRYGIVPGSKHAPVHTVKIIPRLPFSQSHVRELSDPPLKGPAFTPFVDENLRQDTKPPAFTPFVDENLRQDPKPTSRFQPYLDPDLQSSTSSRNASSPPPALSNENVGAIPRPARIASSSSGENSGAKPGAVFSKVFTPAPTRREEPQKAQNTRPGKLPTFTPLRDPKQPSSFKVFSRPTAQDENTPMTPRTTFRPFIDPDSRPENNHDSKPRRVLFGSATQEEEYFDEQEEEEEGRAHTPEYEEGVIELRTPGADQNDENVGPSYRARYAADIDIMTPIAERTFEVTTTSSLPSAFKIKDATVAAMQLAAELRQEEEQELGQQEPLRYAADAAYPSQHPMDEDEEDEDHFMTDDPMLQDTESRTGSLSLFDAMDVASSFRPPNPCTPFDPSIASTLLSLLPANSAFHDYRNEEAVQLADLQKFCKKQERRGNSSSSSSSDRYPLPLGNVQYEVLSKLGEGGFGAVFAAEDITLADDDPDEVIPVAIKVVRPKNLWEFHVLHNLRSSLPPDLRTSIIEPHALFAFRDESFLILEMCSRGTLLDLVNRVHEINVGQKGACLDELLVVFFTIELLRLLEGMHARGFIHGDLKIDNCLLRLEDVPRGSSAWSSAYHPDGSGGWNYKGIKLIDFGRTIDTRQFPKGQQFVADWPTDVRDCREMREGEPWSYQPDYFGLAGIVYCMLYGRYFDEKSVIEAQEGAYKLNASFKRYWQVDLWTELFDLLLNPTLVRPGGQLPLCAELASIRLKFEEWLQKNDRGVARSLQGLIKKVAIASERG